MADFLRQLFLVFSLFCMISCSKQNTAHTSNSEVTPGKPQGTVSIEISADPRQALAPFLNRVWRVSNSPYGPAGGSIYIFLGNGTLLETSCAETYRIALWSVDQTQPDTLRVVEDQQPVFTATLGEASGNALRLHQKFLRGSETREITLTAVDHEFVCPDLRK
jgi:hypothetical protein